MVNLWRRFRAWPIWAQAPIVLAVVFFALTLVTRAFLPDGVDTEIEAGPPTTGAVRPSTTAAPTAPTAPSTSTTVPGLPAGDDTAVTRVTDGDSLVVGEGTRIRLIGIDTPEVESDDCYSAEATRHLSQLAPVGTRVRLVYDAGRLDVYGRTLAYVYRLSDGLFVNVAQARDGFAHQLTVPPNVAHADDIGKAVGEARTANRGLWSACPTATATPPVTSARTAPLTSNDATIGADVVPDDPIPDPPPGDDLQPLAEPAGGCHPSYGGCVPIASDVDCGGGKGNGPAYVYEKDIPVIGPDVYGLDSDNDGIGCES